MQNNKRNTNKKISSSTIEKRLNKFLKDRPDINSRYSSFDLCYLYFKTNKGKLTGNKLHLSCLQLWAFLGSWGMITRGNALQKKSYASLKEAITFINDNPQYYRVDLGHSDYVTNILDLYKGIKKALNLKQKNQKTLITKIILGFYGICTAFDTKFCESFNCHTQGDLNKSDLEKVVSFYLLNKDIINNYKRPSVLKFDGSKSNMYYTIAKLVDMIGFTRKL